MPWQPKIRTNKRLSPSLRREIEERKRQPHWRVFVGGKDSHFVVVAKTPKLAREKVREVLPRRVYRGGEITVKKFQLTL